MEITEIRDDEGRVARIERHDSYAGAVCVRLDATEAQTPYPTQWVLPAIESVPSFYPSGVPFVGGLACQVLQASDRLHVSWRDENRTAPDPELSKRFGASVPASLRQAVDALQERRDAGESVEEVSLEEITERLGDESLREWTAALMKASEPDERFVAAFDSIVNDCLETGWHEEEEPDNLTSAHRTVALRHGNLRRALVLVGALGMSGLSMTQEPVEAPESA